MALVRFLRSVNYFVSAQRAGQAKSLAAYGTNKRLGAGVGWHLKMDG